MVQRALGDVAVPFESLSGGAQEQISLLARLAASVAELATWGDE